MTEKATTELAGRGVNVAVVRLPQVHDTEKQGLITLLVDIARAKQLSAYVGEGTSRWSAAAVDDVVTLYRLALERAAAHPRPGVRYHAVGEEGVALRAVAEAIGKGLGVESKSLSPEEATGHFGFLGAFVGHDLTAKSEWTRATLGWNPVGPTLIEDLTRKAY